MKTIRMMQRGILGLVLILGLGQTAWAGWTYNSGAGTISDGNWILKVTVSGNDVTISGSARMAGSGELDLSSFATDCSPKQIVSFGGANIMGSTTAARTAITNLVMSSSVINIADNAFKACTALTNVVLSANLVNIGVSAFDGCSALTTVSPFLPGSVESVGNSAFQNSSVSCKLIGDLVLTNSNLRTISSSAFKFAKLTSVTMGNGVTNIGTYAFCYCSALTNVVLSTSLRSLGANAFSACVNLATVTPFLPDSVVSIGNDAFNINSSKLTGDLTLMNSDLSSIPSSAFKFAMVTSVMLGNGLTNISDNVFSNAKKIERFWFCGAVPTFGALCFNGLPAYTTRFYASLSQSGWSTFLTTPLTSTETNTFTTTYPGERLPIGTWTPVAASGKQWLCTWSPPGDALLTTVILVR